MSLKVKTRLFKELNYQNIEIMLYNYTRVFFDENTAMANEFAEEINNRKDSINERNNTNLKAYTMGRNNTLVMIEGLGTLLERNPEDFNAVQTLIKRYVLDTHDGSAKDLIKVSPKRKKKTSSDAVVVRKKKKPKKKTKKSKPAPKTSGLNADGEVEEYIRDYVVDAEVATCKEMVSHLTKQFDLDEEEAYELLDAWGKKNEGDELEYDPTYEDGEGLISSL